MTKNQTQLKTHGKMSSVVQEGSEAVGVVWSSLVGESWLAPAGKCKLDGTLV